MKHIFFSLRPKQWIKNSFIYLPLIFGNKLFILPAVLKASLAILLFSLAAGAVYLINDIMDLASEFSRGNYYKTFIWYKSKFFNYG